MINVLLVDDQTLVRASINSLLSLSDNVNVVVEESEVTDTISILESETAIDVKNTVNGCH